MKYQLFGKLRGEEYASLEADILKRGIMVPVELDEAGDVLDGHHRVEIAEKHNLPYKTVTRHFQTEAEKREHVIMLNLARRHLEPYQWGLAFEKLLEAKGVKRGQASSANKRHSQSATIADLAARTGVSERTARDRLAKADDFKALPKKLKTAVLDRLMDVGGAVKVATASQDVQHKVIAKLRNGDANRPMEALRQVKADSVDPHPKTVSGKYGVIYADPPWSYGNTQPDYHTEQRDHYPVMELDAICAMPVNDWTTDNAVLFLWVTSPILEESFRVIKAWGFRYKASFIWDKVKHNMGHYNSVRHEFLLICTKGTATPEVRKLFDSVITEERTTHSTKPSVFYEIIETLYPSSDKLELFARKQRKGWQRYGNELH